MAQNSDPYTVFLFEQFERLCDELAVPPPLRETMASQLRKGFAHYGLDNHLRMSSSEVRAECREEEADTANMHCIIPWSRAYSRARRSYPRSDAIEIADESLNRDGLNALLDAFDLLWGG